MTTEDKAKAYDEALEKAKQALKTDLHESGAWAIKSIFPKLAKSEEGDEDEKIIEGFYTLIRGIRRDGGLTLNKVPLDKCEAWLEKQKEQPKEELVYRLNGLMQDYIKEGKDEEEKKHRFKCYKLFWDALEDGEFFEQKEQKPIKVLYISKFRTGDLVRSSKNPRLTYKILSAGSMNELGNPEYEVEIFTDGKPDEPRNLKHIEIEKMDSWGELVKQNLSTPEDIAVAYQMGLADGRREQKPVITGDDVAWIDDLKQDLEHPEELDRKVQEVLKKRKKPVEYLDKDKVYAIMTKLTNLSYSQLIPVNSDEFKKLHEITSDVRDLLDYPIEQKPAEWKPLPESMEALLLAIEGKWDAIKPTGYMSRRLEDLYDGLVNTFDVDEKYLGNLPKTEYTEKDIEEIKALKEKIDLSMEQKPAVWSEEYREEDVQTRFAFYTYKDDPSVLYLFNVFVEEASRNHGFGTRILKAAEKAAEAIGATTIRLKVKQDSLANVWYRKNGYGYMTFEDGYDWLEKNLEYMKPTKQEWSEKDEEMRLACVDIIEHFPIPSGTVYGPWGDCIKWLKSLRPQPHWKPTKEMLDALKWAKCEFHPDYPETMEQLQYLYTELKKIYYDGN